VKENDYESEGRRSESCRARYQNPVVAGETRTGRFPSYDPARPVPQRGSGGVGEHPAEAAHGFALHVGHHVRVGVQLDQDQGVAEGLLEYVTSTSPGPHTKLSPRSVGALRGFLLSYFGICPY
jgi:hypothetical protein